MSARVSVSVVSWHTEERKKKKFPHVIFLCPGPSSFHPPPPRCCIYSFSFFLIRWAHRVAGAMQTAINQSIKYMEDAGVCGRGILCSGVINDTVKTHREQQAGRREKERKGKDTL